MVCFAAVMVAILAVQAHAQGTPGEFLYVAKISADFGDFTGKLSVHGHFGSGVALLGDVDGDGVQDLAVGEHRADVAGAGDSGAVWILLMNANGTVKSHQLINGLTMPLGALDDDDQFGYSVAPLGDFNGDGTPDLAVGAPNDDDGGANFGAVWLLFLNDDGSLKSQSKISAASGGFVGPGFIGRGVASLGDHDGDGVVDLATSGGQSVWILLLNDDGTVKSQLEITEGQGGFGGSFVNFADFGEGMAALGDLDGDGVGDLAVGAPLFGSGGGGVWILFLRPQGWVSSEVFIREDEAGFTADLFDDRLGHSLTALGDLDGDGVGELAAGAPGAVSLTNTGAVWILFMNPDGTVHDQLEITGGLDPTDQFGWSVAALGDLDGDGRDDLAVGAIGDDDGVNSAGAVWILFLNATIWLDLENGLAGTTGIPQLVGAGSLVGGDLVDITLTGAAENANAWLTVGFDVLNAPLFGGVLVPDINPPGFATPVFTDAAGSLALSGPWPAGVPSGFTTYIQVWVEDPGGPFGFAASNATSGTTP